MPPCESLERMASARIVQFSDVPGNQVSCLRADMTYRLEAPNREQYMPEIM